MNQFYQRYQSSYTTGILFLCSFVLMIRRCSWSICCSCVFMDANSAIPLVLKLGAIYTGFIFRCIEMLSSFLCKSWWILQVLYPDILLVPLSLKARSPGYPHHMHLHAIDALLFAAYPLCFHSLLTTLVDRAEMVVKSSMSCLLLLWKLLNRYQIRPAVVVCLGFHYCRFYL